MVNSRRCFVPGCHSGYDSEVRENKRLGIRNHSLFKAKGESQLLKWRKAIPRLDRVMSNSDVVCELHFPECDIIRFFETRLLDGSVHRMARERPTLKPEAIPTVFPNLPKYLTKKHTPRKPPKDRSHRKAMGSPQDFKLSKDPKLLRNGVVHRIERQSNALKTGAVPTIFPPPDSHKGKKRSGQVEKPPGAATPERCDISDAEDCGMSEVVPEPFDFQVLMKEALNLSLPSDMWTVGVLKGNQVIFANWTDGETFEAKKRVLIDDELHVKIFFGNVIASLHNMKEVHSLAEVAAFLIVIDQLNICQSVRSPECLGYTIPRELSDKGTSAAICRNCCKAEKDSLHYGGKEVVGSIKSQSKILKKAPMSSEHSDQLHKKRKRKVLLEKGVIPDGKPSSEGAVKRVCGEAPAEGDGDTDSEEEVDIEEWAPPPEWHSLATPMRLLSPPPENVIRPTFTLPEALEKRGEEVTSSLDIETLVRDVHCIALPSDTWTLGVVKGKRLIFASWKVGKVLEAEKRLVVDEDLSVKVIFGNMILALDEIRNVINFEDIGRYLYIVDKMSKCNGIGTGRRTASCPGYFIPGQVRGSCLSRCACCQGASEELTRIRRKKRGLVQVRAEAQGKVWKNLKKLSDLYPEMKRSVKAPAS